MGHDRPPPAAVLASGMVIALMALSTALSVEAWPLGPWELFSRSRKPVQVSYIAKYVAADEERRVDFGSLPPHYSGAHAVLGGFMGLPVSEKKAVCDSWAAALRDSGDAPERIRVYRLERTLRLDGRPPSREEELVHECSLGPSP